MKVIFLDVDGVLNRTAGAFYYTLALPGQRMYTLEKSTVEVFAFYLKHLPQDVKIVVSSSWRVQFESGEDFAKMIGIDPSRMHPDWRTYSNGGDAGNGRSMDIQAWLKEHPDVSTYVIVDDTDYKYAQFFPRDRFVQVDGMMGLTYENLEDILRKLEVTPIRINGILIE